MNRRVLFCRWFDWPNYISLTYQHRGCEFKQHVVSAYSSKFNWLGFAVFLPMVDGSLEALKLLPPRNQPQRNSAKTPINQTIYQNIKICFLYIYSKYFVKSSLKKNYFRYRPSRFDVLRMVIFKYQTFYVQGLYLKQFSHADND